MSGDDLDMGEKGLRLRREQWEEVRSGKMIEEREMGESGGTR